MVPLDRIKAIATRAASAGYATVGQCLQRPARVPVYKHGVASLAYGEQLPVVIKNLSPTGCRIEYFQNRILEGRILLTESSIPLRVWGHVIWQGDCASGLEFDAPNDCTKLKP